MKRLLFESKKGLLVELTLEATTTMTSYAGDAGAHETGGILVGHYVDGHRVCVDTIIGPPPDSRRGRAWFERGTAGVRTKLQNFWDASERRYYVGEWHFHPAFDGTPSPQDVKQMHAFASQPRVQCSEPLMIIVSFDTEHRWAFRVFFFGRADGMEELRRLSAS